MDISLNIESKQINPAVINLRQHSNETDVLTFVMQNYVTDTTDLSMLNAYAVCDLGGTRGIDKVKLNTAIVDGALKITWKVTGYTTLNDGHVTYHIVFARETDDPETNPVWYSHQAVILVNSSLNADEYIAARYPSILQQWEKRMAEELVKVERPDVNLSDVDAETMKGLWGNSGVIRCFFVPLSYWNAENKTMIAYDGLTEFSSVELQYQPTPINVEACEAANVRISAITDNEIELSCDTLPTMDIVVDILYQGEKDKFYTWDEASGSWSVVEKGA